MGALGNLIPLVILLLAVAGFAYIGYQVRFPHRQLALNLLDMSNRANSLSSQMYLFANELSERGKNHMQKKNIVFGKDGLKVGVKEIRNEDYEDKTQRSITSEMLLQFWQQHTRSRRDANANGLQLPRQDVEQHVLPGLQEQALEYCCPRCQRKRVRRLRARLCR